jgi:hypothetical protein
LAILNEESFMQLQSKRAWRRLVTSAAVLGMLTVSSWRVAAQSTPTTLPKGTPITVRTIDVVDSKGVVSDKDYRGTVDDPVVVNGVTVVPTGAAAFLRVVAAQQAGAVTGTASVSLRLVGVETNGRRLAVDTGEATIQSGSQGKKTGKSAGGGAVIGGVLGGILGGKRGLVKGAVSGAVVGVAVAVVTGEKVHVPAETRLSFALAKEIAFEPR